MMKTFSSASALNSIFCCSVSLVGTCQCKHWNVSTSWRHFLQLLPPGTHCGLTSTAGCTKTRPRRCCPRRKGISYGQGAVVVKEHRSALIIAPGLKVTTDDFKGPKAGFVETVQRLGEDFIKPKSLKKSCLSGFTSSPGQGEGLGRRGTCCAGSQTSPLHVCDTSRCSFSLFTRITSSLSELSLAPPDPSLICA